MKLAILAITLCLALVSGAVFFGDPALLITLSAPPALVPPVLALLATFLVLAAQCAIYRFFREKP